MEIIGLNNYQGNDILSEELFNIIFSEKDEIERMRMVLSCEDRAKVLGVKSKFDKMYASYSKVYKQTEKESSKSEMVIQSTKANLINFELPEELDGHLFSCGVWEADDTGIYTMTDHYPFKLIACPHPIIPVERLRNIETGEEQIRIAFRRGHRWEEITVPKEMIASAQKIVGLSKYGVAVTSETAKQLVKFMMDAEMYNEDLVKLSRSTTKLGWHENAFLPYDEGEIDFDGARQFKDVFASIKSAGSRDKWYRCMRDIRRSGRIEPRICLAASFASALIEPLGLLSFFVDLYGETENGKSVCLMVAASVWANPGESKYIGDFKTTETALEVKADMLNSLPVLLDDTSKAQKKISDNFESVVYDLCSGRGKARSNRELGINRQLTWSNCFLSNGERPLQSYVQQGGALNRIIEVESIGRIFKDAPAVAECMKSNYGFAGAEFIDIVRGIGIDGLKEIYDNIFRQLSDDGKMQKQTMSMACILTADQIINESIFHDDRVITLDEAKELLTDRESVSDNVRCYNYLLDKVSMNQFRFNDQDANIEKWGMLFDDYAIFYVYEIEKLCAEEGYNFKSFEAWAIREGYSFRDAEGKRKQKKIFGTNTRGFWLKVSDGFLPADDEEHPFIE